MNNLKDFRINILEDFRVKMIWQGIVRYNSSALVFSNTSYPPYNGDEIFWTAAFPGQHPMIREHARGTASFLLLPGWSLWCAKISASHSKCLSGGKDISSWPTEVALSTPASRNPTLEPYWSCGVSGQSRVTCLDCKHETSCMSLENQPPVSLCAISHLTEAIWA